MDKEANLSIRKNNLQPPEAPVTVHTSLIPRGVALQTQGDTETGGRQTAVFAVCVHAFVAVKPGGLNSNKRRPDRGYFRA